MHGEEDNKGYKLECVSEFDMTVRVFKGGSFEHKPEIKQMKNVLKILYEELQNDIGKFALFIDIQVNGRNLDGLLLIEHPEEEERNVAVVVELKDVSGDIIGNLNEEDEQWYKRTSGDILDIIKYKNGKKVKPMTQCRKNRGGIAFFLKDYLFKEKLNDEDFTKIFSLIHAITVLPDDANIGLENYKPKLKLWFEVINERDIVENITQMRKDSDLSIDFEKTIKLLKKHATKPNSKEKIKELKEDKERKQFWRDLKGVKDESKKKTEPTILYPQLKNKLDSDNKRDIEYAIEVIDYLDLDAYKDEILSLGNNKDYEIRIIALENLDKWLEGKELTLEILKYVDDECIGVWKRADELMYAYGTRSALPRYTKIVKESNYFDRVNSAINVLKSIGDDDTVELLVDLYDNYRLRFEDAIERKVNRESRYYEKLSKEELEEKIERDIGQCLESMESKILDTIIEIGGPKVIPFAKRLLDENMDEYQKLHESYKSHRGHNQSKSLQFLKVGSKVSKAIGLLGKSRNKNAIPLLSDLIKNEKYENSIKNQVIDALSELGSEGAVRILIDVLNDKKYDFLIQIEAIKCLGKFESKAGLEHLHLLLEKENPTEYLGMDQMYSRQLEIEIINALGKIGSKTSFEPLYNKYDLINNKIWPLREVLIKLDKDIFEEKLFEKLRSDDIEEKEKYMNYLVQGENRGILYKLGQNRIEELIEILKNDIENNTILGDELIEKIFNKLYKNDLDEKPIEVVNKIVDKANLYNPYDSTEKIEDIELLLCLSGLNTEKDILSNSIFKLICDNKELSEKHIEMIKKYINSDKPILRVIGIDLIDTLYSHDEFNADEHIPLEDFIDMRKNGKMIVILKKLESECKSLSRFIDRYNIHIQLIRCLEKVEDEEAIKHLFEYLKSDGLLISKNKNQAYISLLHIMYSKNVIGKGYGEENDIPIPEWILEEITAARTDFDLDINEYCKFIAYYWQEQAIELFNGYIIDEDERLKLSVIHALHYFDIENAKAILRKLILEQNRRISEVAISTYNNITGKKLYDNDVIWKAEIDEL